MTTIPTDRTEESDLADTLVDSVSADVDAWLADDTVVALGSAEEDAPAAAQSPWMHLDAFSSWLLRVALALIIVVLATAGAMVVFFMTVQKAPRTAVERDIAAAEIAVRDRPSDAAAWQTLAYTYARGQRYDDAITTIRKARSSTRAQALLLPEAEILRVAGRLKESLSVYDEAIAVVSAEESAAVAARKKKGIDMAAPNASLVRAYYGRGLSRHSTGDTPGAIRDTLQALALAPDQANMRVTLADLYAESGQKALAEAAYREALRYVPDYREAILGLQRLEKGP